MADSKQVEFRELGVSGLRTRHGLIEEEFLTDLRGSKGRKVFRKMAETDPTIGALLFSIKQIIRSARWHSEPGGGSDLDREAASFIYSCINDMSSSWPTFVSEACSMLEYGWAYFEIIWKKRLGRFAKPPSKYNDGRIGIRKLAIRGQNTLYKWEFDSNGGIKGMWQLSGPVYKPIFIPITKSLLFRTDVQRGNPEGKSILASSYTAWYYLTHLKEIEAIGVERDLAGLPLLHAPVSIFTDSDKATLYQDLKDLVVNVRRDELEGLLLPYDPSAPESYKFELLSSGGKRQFSTSDIINRYKIEILQTVLADFISVGYGNTGSYALIRTKRDLFELGVLGILDNIKGILNSHLIPRLIEVNPEFAGLKNYPTLEYSIAKIPQLDELSRLISALARAKVDISSNQDAINQILSEAGLPPIRETDNSVPKLSEVIDVNPEA